MAENEAQKQSGEIISNALSAASEILNLPNRQAQDMIDISQKLADRIIQAAKELSRSGVKSAANVPHESGNSSKIASISDILKEYEDNSIVAQRKYKHKRLTFQGEIEYITETSSEGHTSFRVVFLVDNYSSISCYFASKYENIILSLKKGQILTVNGEWDYYDDYTEIELHDCEIVSAE